MKKDIFEPDSSAILYPFVGNKKVTHSYVMEADVDVELDPAILREAANAVCERFPAMFVVLKKKRFGYCLEHIHDGASFVMERPAFINAPYPIREGEKLIRIIYRKNRIGIEYFHIVTDGYGAITLLKSLMAEYFRRLGEDVENTLGVLSPEEEPKDYELEDAFRVNYRKELGTESRSGKRAFQAAGAHEDWHYTELCMKADDLKRVVKASGATMTEYVTALYLYAFYLQREKIGSKKPISMAVPVNLRSFFDTWTLRNFTLFFITNLPEGEVTLESILEQVKKDFKSGTEKDVLQRIININVAQQNLLPFRYAPRFLKRIILRIGFYLFGECLYTSTLSNLGIFKVPEGLDKHLLAFRAILGPVPVNNIHSTAYCSKGNFAITFTSRLAGREIENEMKRLLEEKGVPTYLRDEEELLPIPEKVSVE